MWLPVGLTPWSCCQGKVICEAQCSAGYRGSTQHVEAQGGASGSQLPSKTVFCCGTVVILALQHLIRPGWLQKQASLGCTPHWIKPREFQPEAKKWCFGQPRATFRGKLPFLFHFLKKLYLYLFIYFSHAACRILVPWPRIKPMSPAVEARSLICSNF